MFLKYYASGVILNNDISGNKNWETRYKKTIDEVLE